MATKREITPDLIRQVLDYNPATGLFIWKERPVSMFAGGFFSPEHDAAIWNKRYAGAPALYAANRQYRQGSIFNVKITAHRAAWAHYYGEWPEDDVDHINGDGADNRIENLRDVVKRVNTMNCRLAKSNTSGMGGVHFCTRTQMWVASFNLFGKNQLIGRFEEKRDAMIARGAVNVALKFTERHGRSPTWTAP